MKSVLFKTLATVCIFINTSAYALSSSPKIEFDNDNVYIQVPAGKEWIASRMKEVSQNTVSLMQEKVAQMLASGEMPFELSVDTINQIQNSAAAMEEFIEVADAYNKLNDESYKGQSWQELVPTAFLATLGVKVSISVGGSASGSITMGLVVMPMLEYVVPRRPNESLTDFQFKNMSDAEFKSLVSESTEKRFTLSWTIVGWPNFDVGAGLGASAGAVRVGGGLIWGPLKSAQDFKGVVLGGSTNVALLAGVNVKFGFVQNSLSAKDLFKIKYVLGGLEMGATAEAAARVNVSAILTKEQLLRYFLPEGTELSGEEIIENYKKKQANRNNIPEFLNERQ